MEQMQNSQRRIGLGIVGFCVALYALVGAVNGLYTLFDNASNKKLPNNTMTVSADGKTEATPDLALLSFSVNPGGDPATFVETTAAKIAVATDLAHKAGVEEKNIISLPYGNGWQVIFEEADKKQDIMANFITDLKKLSKNDGSETTITFTSGCLTFKDMTAATAPAREDALRNAKIKALDFAHKTGKTLGDIVTIGDNNQTPSYYNNIYGGVTCTNSYIPGVNFKKQYLASSLNVTYEMK